MARPENPLNIPKRLAWQEYPEEDQKPQREAFRTGFAAACKWLNQHFSAPKTLDEMERAIREGIKPLRTMRMFASLYDVEDSLDGMHVTTSEAEAMGMYDNLREPGDQ